MAKQQTNQTNSIANNITHATYYILAVVLPLVVLVCLGLYYLLAQAQMSVSLIGEVEVILEELLSPEEFAEREDNAIFLDTPFTEHYGTSRICLRVSDDGWYTLTRTSIDHATRTYVNGELLTEVGSPADNRDDVVSNIGRITFTVQAVDGEIELNQQSVNFVHRTGGYHGG